MQIGILITNIGDAGQKGFYNIQEVGLARALDKITDRVWVYKLVPIHTNGGMEPIEGCHNAYLKKIPAHKLGSNGVFDVRILDSSLDVLIYFSDMQLIVPWVYRWSVRNNVIFLPYIGVVKSHSTNVVRRKMMDLISKRVIQVYSQNGCLVKTPRVEEELRNTGVKNTMVVSVGLDTYLTDYGYLRYDKADLKCQFGYRPEEKIILFVGRLTEEKQPIRMLEIYDKLLRQKVNYRLLMVGTGRLKRQVEAFVKERGLFNYVKLIDRIENSQICKLYRMADVFVNLNQQEIFGMAILEAMYYECKVVAWSAPGPELLIENGISGWIVRDEDEVMKRILDKREVGKNAHDRVERNFTWDKSAERIYGIIRGTS